MEARILDYAVTRLVPEHMAEVQGRKEELLDRTRVAVLERLTKEINHWDLRAQELRLQEEAGKTPRLNSAMAQRRADDLQARLQRRLAEIEQERRLSAAPPVVIGGALVVPAGLLARAEGDNGEEAAVRETRRSELLAMAAVMAAERALGHEPRDVSAEKCGYDVESRMSGTGRLRFIEVKGRHPGAETVTLTRNEILTGLNKPEDFILAIVEVDGERVRATRYVRRPFRREPDFAATSVNYDLNDLLSSSHDPE